ncbi:hypothetical protein [Streptomyces sp. WAC06614]|uniref:WXG100-like domain-containing protein n=1 Tax=Streptomyces sp. WAC06614 TaxID=2487416 RepID=UPI000F7AACA6|nr:hypothetical protein [Streptomyces sp. WAC06614]RSS83742.1 hypothetical protein EF918_02755 [Streptomyces sp. WAC06614]
MSIMLPPELAELFAVLAGGEWPEADESALRVVGDDYQAIADDIPKLTDYIVELVNVCLQRFEGQAADAFVAQMRWLIGQGGGNNHLGQAADHAKELAKAARDTANQVEYAKWSTIAQLVQLAAEIVFAIFWAPYTLGASLSGLSFQYLFTREAIRLILTWLRNQILLHTFANVAGGLFIDATVQLIQIGDKHRTDWDTAATLQALESGVVNGVIAGPLNLVGMGVGSVIGNAVGKSGGKVLGKELGAVMKGASKEAAPALAGAAAAAPAAASRASGRWLGEGASKAFAKDIGSLMQATSTPLQTGFAQSGKGSIAGRFGQHMERAFEKHLGEALGTNEAKQLGREFGEAFTANWRRGGAENAALNDVLHKVLDPSALSGGGVKALAESLPELAATMGNGNRMFQLGEVLGQHLVEGAQNTLGEGLYNLVFGENHEFSAGWQSFVSGVAMGALGHAGHLAASPFTAKYTEFVRTWQSAPLGENDGKYFGPLHPLTLLSVAANLSGNSAPFPVPRLGAEYVPVPAADASAPPVRTTSGGDGADRPRPSTETDAPRPVRTQSGGGEAGSAPQHEPAPTTGPTAGHPPVTAEPPVVSVPPVTAEAPVVSVPPVTAEPPVVSVPPVTAEAPVVSVPPVTAEPPVVSVPPVTAEPPLHTDPSPTPTPTPTPPTESGAVSLPHEVPGAGDPPGHTPADPAYDYVPAPSHGGDTQPDAGRAADWQQAQRDLQDDYTGKAREAARDTAAETEAEQRFAEAFADWSNHLPDGATDELTSAIRHRAHDLMAEQLAQGRPREEVLAGLDDLITLASFREAGVRVGMERFDQVARDRHAQDLSEEAAARVRDHMAGVFRQQVETAVAGLYAEPGDVRDALQDRTAGARRKLDEMSAGLRRDLELRAEYERVRERADRAVDQLATHWRDGLTQEDADLLRAGGVARDAELSEDSLRLIGRDLRDRLVADFIAAFGSADSAAGLSRDGAAAAIRTVAEAFDRHTAGLSHAFAVQAVREAAIRKIVDQVEAAAPTWRDTVLSSGGGSRLHPGAAEALGLSGADAEPFVRAVTVELVAATDQRLLDHLARPDAPGDLVTEQQVHDLFTLKIARDVAATAANRQAEAAAAAFGEGRGLTDTSRRRVGEGYEQRILEAFDTVFGDPAALHDAERLALWTSVQDALLADLPLHLAFEAEAMPALGHAAATFDRLTDGRSIGGSRLADLKRDYGKDWFAAYRKLWGPGNLHADRWHAHEQAHEGTFAARPAGDQGALITPADRRHLAFPTAAPSPDPERAAMELALRIGAGPLHASVENAPAPAPPTEAPAPPAGRATATEPPERPGGSLSTFAGSAGPGGRDLHEVPGTDISVQSRPLGPDDGSRPMGRAYLDPEGFDDLDELLPRFRNDRPVYHHVLIDEDLAPDEPGYVKADLGDFDAPWANGPDPYVVLADEYGGTRELTVTDEDGDATSLGWQEFAAVVAADPVLAGLPEDVPVVLAVSRGGGGGLELPRAVASATGRVVYALTGDTFVDQLGGDGGETWSLGLKAAFMGADGYSRPRGGIVRVDPPSKGGVDHRIGPGPGSVTTTDGRSIPDPLIETRPVLNLDGVSKGSASFEDAHWAVREGPYAHLDRLADFERRFEWDEPTGLTEQVPYDPEHAYFFVSHAGPPGFTMEVTGQPPAMVSGTEVGGFLRRRPSVVALKEAAAQGKPASLVLLGCQSAQHAQDVAREVGLPVHAPTATAGVVEATPGALYDTAQQPQLFLRMEVGTDAGEFHTYHPAGDDRTTGTSRPPADPSASVPLTAAPVENALTTASPAVLPGLPADAPTWPATGKAHAYLVVHEGTGRLLDDGIPVTGERLALSRTKPRTLPQGSRLLRLNVQAGHAVDLKRLVSAYPSRATDGGDIAVALGAGTDLWLPAAALSTASVDKVYATGSNNRAEKGHELRGKNLGELGRVEHFADPPDEQPAAHALPGLPVQDPWQVSAFAEGAGPGGRDLHEVPGTDVTVQSRPLGPGDGSRPMGRAYLDPGGFAGFEAFLPGFRHDRPVYRHVLVDQNLGSNDPGYVKVDLGDFDAPWASGPAPYFVLGGDYSGKRKLTLTDEDGDAMALGWKKFAGVVAADPVLAGLPEHVPVVLAISRGGGGGLELPRAVASATGRVVYALTGDTQVVPLGAGGWSLGLKGVFDGADGDGLPRGGIVRVDPPSKGGVDHRAGPGPGSVTTTDGRTVPDSLIETRPIPNLDGISKGRASFTDSHWAVREGPYGHLDQLTEFEQWSAWGVPSGRPPHVPYDPEHAYFFSAHADARGFRMEVTGRSVAVLSGTEVGGFLRRRPSVVALKEAVAQGKPASLVLLGCNSAQHAQDVAREVGLPVHAPTATRGVVPAVPGHYYDTSQKPRHFLLQEGSDAAEFRTFHPDGDDRKPAVPARPANRQHDPRGVDSAGGEQGDGAQDAPTGDAYRTAADLLAALESSTVVPDVRTLPAPGPIGVDLFGILEPMEAPHFLLHPETREPYDYTNLTADQAAYFLHLMDMRYPVSAEDMDPAGWDVGKGEYSVVHTRSTTTWAPGQDVAPLDSTEVAIPGIVQAIWFGPFRPDGPSAGFWERFGEAARTHGDGAFFVLWTDLPRHVVDAVYELDAAPADPELADAWRMVRWADDADIRLVNPFEVYHKGRPMPLHNELMTELAKLTGRGKAAASDIFRLVAGHDFGGLYSDGDNRITSLSALAATARSKEGFATHSNGATFGNSAFVAPAEHPYLSESLAEQKSNYRKTQKELYGPDAMLMGKEFYLGETGRPRRNSVMLRTGPDSQVPVAKRLGYPHVAKLPSLSGVDMGFDASWLRPVPPAQRTWTAPQTLHFTQQVIHSMVRSLYNRDGDLHLTDIHDAIVQHPQPELIWEAALTYLGSREDLRPLVKGITLTRLTEPDAPPFEVELPESVRDLFQPVEGGQAPIGDADGWWLADRSVPVRMTEPASAGSGAGAGPDHGRVKELADALALGHDSGAHLLDDPSADAGRRERTAESVARFPHDDRFFTVVMHSGDDGAPQWRGASVTPGQLAGALAQLHRRQVWDVAKPLQLAGCSLGRGGEGSYAADVLRELRRLLPGLDLEAYVPDGTLWFVPQATAPHRTDATGTGHLVVGPGAGFDGSGRPVVNTGGQWLRLTLPKDAAEVAVQPLGAHLPPDGSTPPNAADAPDGYTAVTGGEGGQDPALTPLDGAESFGTDDVRHSPGPGPATWFAPPGGADLGDVLGHRPGVPDQAAKPSRLLTEYTLVSPPGAQLEGASPAERLAKAPFAYRLPSRLESVMKPEDELDFVMGTLTGVSSFPVYQPARPVEVPAHPELRVSGDGTLAIADHDGPVREFYALPELVDDARRKLDLAGSDVRLVVDPETRITFDHDGEPRTLHKVAPQFAGAPKDVCRDFSADVLGGDHSHILLQDVRPPGRGGTGTTVTAPINTANNAEVSGIAHLAEEVGRLLGPDGDPDEADLGRAAALIGQGRHTEAGKWPVPGAEYGTAQYRAARETDAALRWREVSERLGINARAFAMDPGDGYVIQSVPSSIENGLRAYEQDYARGTDEGVPDEHADGVGYHFAPVVVTSQDKTHHLALQNFNQRKAIRNDMRDAVEANLAHYGADIEAVAHELEASAARGEIGVDDARLRLAQSLHGIRQARQEQRKLAAHPDAQAERAEWARAESGWMVNATRALIGLTGDSYGKSGEAWYFSLHGRAKGESFFDSWAELGLEGSSFSNPLAAVVRAGHQDAKIELPVGPAGAPLSVTAVKRLEKFADHVAKVALWKADQGLRPPVVTVASQLHPQEPVTGLGAKSDAVLSAFHDLLGVRLAQRQAIQPLRSGGVMTPRHIELVQDVVLRDPEHRTGDGGRTDGGIDSLVTLHAETDGRSDGRISLGVAQLEDLARQTGAQGRRPSGFQRRASSLLRAPQAIGGAPVTATDVARMKDVVHLVRGLTDEPGLPDPVSLADGRRLSDLMAREFGLGGVSTPEQLDPLVRKVFGLEQDAQVSAQQRADLLQLANRAKQPGKPLTSDRLRSIHTRSLADDVAEALVGVAL